MTWSRFSNEEIISAYQQTGSVWAAGRKLGLAGQTVHGRLNAAGFKIGTMWSNAETNRLRELVGQATIGQIADELGRSYASIACKINDIGVGSRHGNRIKRKLPRGVGFDKVSTKRHLKAIEASEIPISRWAKQHGFNVDQLIRAIEKHEPEWWIEYRNSHSDLPEAVCPNCGTLFYPSNKRQVWCRRQCGTQYKVDQEYFGGKRNNTTGLAEGICQICGRKPGKGLSSHHVLGKENDPDNNWLVALCSGCHNVITALGARDFNTEQWEALVSFAWLRRHGKDPKRGNSLYVIVEIDEYDDEDDE